MYFLGRGLDYAVAMEGSLKLKKYLIYTRSVCSRRIKTWTNSLIEDDTTVIALATQDTYLIRC